MTQPEVSCIVTCHAEEPQWAGRAIESLLKQIDAPKYEIIVVADCAKEETIKGVNDAVRRFSERSDVKAVSGGPEVKLVEAEYADLGLSRNHGFGLAKGRYCLTLDADDLHSCVWIKEAYSYARNLREERKAAGLDPDMFCLHPEYMLMFGSDKFLHRCIGDDSPEFDAKDFAQWNQFAATAFGPREMFLKYPYFKAGNGYGFEDMAFHIESFGAGVSHRVVPKTVYAVRLKGDDRSMAFRYQKQHLVAPKAALYDRRDLPDAAKNPTTGEDDLVAPEIHQQAKFMHYEIGELEVSLIPQMVVRRYPRQRTFADQGALRDAIGDAEHVVLVRRLEKGGAEKYAIDWSKAIADAGKKICIVETEPAKDKSQWTARAESAGVRVIPWRLVNQDLVQDEAAYALRRALVQADPKTTFVCNATIGWQLIHENMQVLGQRVFAASFAAIPFGHGFSSCPPIYLHKVSPNFRLITDNAQHRDRLKRFNPELPINLIPPRCDYDGPSKLSRIDKPRKRILWAGRGTAEKRPDLLPSLAAAMEYWGDLHVWGDVQPMNGPENLKYRGPFDGFASIDGSYDCYLNTSIFEGCPNVALEAAMADLPIVGPAQGALPEIATYCYKKFDPLTVSEMILSAIDNGHKRQQEVKNLVTNWRDGFPQNVQDLALSLGLAV